MNFINNGQDDYAIIVGLQYYPGLDDPTNGNNPLSGPENDANAFYDWVLSPSGGNLLSQNVTKILSSAYLKEDPNPNYWDSFPTSRDLIEQFEIIRRKSLNKSKSGFGSTIGRRLYIFMSGHGIAPSLYGNTFSKEAALLMCNVPPDNKEGANYHIPGGYVANWFSKNECFEEVFLFMDCCRDKVYVNSINMFFPENGEKIDTTRFYAFSTLETRKSREKIIDGQMQGVFTKTLLDGLNGGSAVSDPMGSGRTQITGKSLKNFLYSSLNSRVDPQYQEPDIDHFPQRNEGEDILIKDFGISSLTTFHVEIVFPLNTAVALEILDGDAESIIASTFITNTGNPALFKIKRGKYLLKATIDDVKKEIFFQVLGIENQTTTVNL